MTKAPPSLDAWEQAYLRFETPDEEVRKFARRLRAAGATRWSPSSRIVELFCGRGGGLEALDTLGFSDTIGVDRSARLLHARRFENPVICGDCRALPLASESCDVAIVQGGLHHLESLPADLDRALGEIERILRPNGRFVAVEPWQTPYLRVAHRACTRSELRRIWSRLDALATMIEHERETYFAWLENPALVRSTLERHFEIERWSVRLGKLSLVGRRRAPEGA